MANGDRSTTKQPDKKLEKMILKCIDPEKSDYDIEFMFNPTELTISRQIKLTENQGERTDEGNPKVDFAHPNPMVMTINNIWIDVYEGEQDKLIERINKLLNAVKFVSKEKDEQRPPIYNLIWGQNLYICCFVEKVSYTLTMFLPDGTPVRAKASLTLKEVDPTKKSSDGKTIDSKLQRDNYTRWS